MVSIIIPYYNRPEKLDRAIQSVLKQSYQDFEVIIVDDCSKLPPQKYLDSRITYLKNDINSGPGKCRNIGLSFSKGEYVCFLDSDDYWHPEFLQKTIDKMLNSSKTLSFVYSMSYEFKGDKLCRIRKNQFNLFHKTILPAILIYSRVWTTSSCLWNKKIIEKSSGWTNYRNWEDYAFDIDLAILNNNIDYVEEPLVYYDLGGEDKLSMNANRKSEKSESLFYISDSLFKSDWKKNIFIKKKLIQLLLSNLIELDNKSNNELLIHKNMNELYKWVGKLNYISIKWLKVFNNRLLEKYYVIFKNINKV